MNFTTKDAADFLAEGETTALRPSLSYSSNGEGARQGLIFANRSGNLEVLGAVNQATSAEMVDGKGTTIAGTAHDSSSALAKAKLTFGQDDSQALTFAYSRTAGGQDARCQADAGLAGKWLQHHHNCLGHDRLRDFG